MFANMITRYKTLLPAILMVVFAGCEKDKEGKIESDPKAVTQSVGNIEMFTATIYGKLVLPDIKPEDFTFGFEYSTDEAFSSSKSKNVRCAFYNTQNENMFSSVLSNLTMATQYYYRAYIIYNKVTYYGEVKSFTTKGIEVVTGDMDPATCEVTSRVEMGADSEKARYGLCYGTSDDPTVENSVIGTNEAAEDGSYTLKLGNIPYGEFFYRAYVTLNGTIYYGEVKSIEGNKVVTGELNPENMSVSAWVKYHSGYDNFTYGICYSLNSTPEYDRDRSVKGGSIGDDNNFSASLLRVPFGTVYYRAYVTIDQKVYYGETYSFENVIIVGKPVDLGLSVKWADINIGASHALDYGLYFAWAETEDKDGSIFANYRYADSEPSARLRFGLTKYNSNPDYGTVDGKTLLEPMDDAATALWGDGWRTPTFDEFKELSEHCNWTWTTKNGVNGYEVQSQVNGNTIFLPSGGGQIENQLAGMGVTGAYWTSSLYEEHELYARLYQFSEEQIAWDYRPRYNCFNVRAVSQ